MAMLCETAEMTGDAAAGTLLFDALRPHAGRLAANLVIVVEPIDLTLRSQPRARTGDFNSAGDLRHVGRRCEPRSRHADLPGT